MIKCVECNKEFDDDAGLHRHLRVHKLLKEEYYQKYFPRYDLLTNEPLEFKSKEYYFGNMFSNRGNCITYIKNLPSNERLNFLFTLFGERKKNKGLVFLPSQVELRSSILPSVSFLNKIGYDYSLIAEKLDLIKKYDYNVKSLAYNNEPLDIIQDTREQKPLRFSSSTRVIVSGLDFSDYTCKSHFNNIFIERKSLVDFVATFSNQIERFEREMHRAQSINATVFVLVENMIGDALAFDRISYIGQRTRITPDYVFHNVKQLIQKYPNLQFGFCDNRTKMAETIEKIYNAKERMTKYDIQYLIDSSVL